MEVRWVEDWDVSMRGIVFEGRIESSFRGSIFILVLSFKSVTYFDDSNSNISCCSVLFIQPPPDKTAHHQRIASILPSNSLSGLESVSIILQYFIHHSTRPSSTASLH